MYFRCKNATYIMWRNQMPLTDKYFHVQCALGGLFDLSAEGWPLCDRQTPKKCTDFPELPETHSEIVELINPDPQLPGGKLYYKCKQEGFISNIGKLVEVTID